MNRFSPHQRQASRGSAPGEMMRAGRDRWLLSYADLVTLLLACFTTAYAAAQVPAPPPPAPPQPATIPAPLAVTSEDPATSPPRRSIRDIIEPIVVAALGDAHVALVEDSRGLVISLPESATFPTGSAALTGEAREFLTRLADALRETTAVLRIEGHTDDVPLTSGRYGSNWELSTARASAVVLFLVGEAAFAPQRLSAAGYGEFHPRAANDTPEQRALNRRVDVVVIDADEGPP